MKMRRLFRAGAFVFMALLGGAAARGQDKMNEVRLKPIDKVGGCGRS